MTKIVNLASLDELKDMSTPDSGEECINPSDPDRYSKLLSYLQAQCVKREYCISDIRKKAEKAAAGDKKLAGELVEMLVTERFVDELRYASAFARDKSAITGWGPSKIRYALTMKGIPRKTIDEALPEIDAELAESRMKKILSAKWKVLREDPYGKFKLIKYGLTRGYGYEAVSACVEELTDTA